MAGNQWQYTNRVTITDQAIWFRMKGFASHGRIKIMEPVLEDFPQGFACLTCRRVLNKSAIRLLFVTLAADDQATQQEASPELSEAATGRDCTAGPGYVCPFFEKGLRGPIAEFPRIRSPSTEYPTFPRRKEAKIPPREFLQALP